MQASPVLHLPLKIRYRADCAFPPSILYQIDVACAALRNTAEGSAISDRDVNDDVRPRGLRVEWIVTPTEVTPTHLNDQRRREVVRW